MDWQQVVALAVVAVTAGLMLWGRLTQRRGGCGAAGCCCPARLKRAGARPGPTLMMNSRSQPRASRRQPRP